MSKDLKVIIVIIIIVIMEFVGREKELEDLEKDFESDNFSLAVIYGRRRVGKTELIKKFCSNKQHIYHLATQDTSENQRKNLEDSIAKILR